MSDRPWENFHRYWPTAKAPLATPDESRAATAAAIEGRRQRALLLGVTPALADLADDTTAVDWSQGMIERVWPGDTACRRAIAADWRNLPVRAPLFSAVIGDGSFNCLSYPYGYREVLVALARVMEEGARFAVRFYVRPDAAETFEHIRACAMRGEVGTIDALKWRVAMAVAHASGANVARDAINHAFDETFPDRTALLAVTHWDENDFRGVDWYKGIADPISFPTAGEILATVPEGFRNPRFVSSGSYELAERCPLLVMDFRP